MRAIFPPSRHHGDVGPRASNDDHNGSECLAEWRCGFYASNPCLHATCMIKGRSTPLVLNVSGRLNFTTTQNTELSSELASIFRHIDSHSPVSIITVSAFRLDAPALSWSWDSAFPLAR